VPVKAYGLSTVGLIVNPVAGIGGAVGLKGSDGEETQRRARELGAVPPAPGRATAALRALKAAMSEVKVVTYPGPMGEDPCREAGIEPVVLGEVGEDTSAEDTRRAALDLQEAGVDLILFVGGDGTARDIYQSVGSMTPILGVPSGVKIHSGVFAVNPGSAGSLAALYLRGEAPLRDAEVMDIDEDAFRRNQLSASLYGYMRVPYSPQHLQGSKEGAGHQEEYTLEAIAADVVEHMEPGVLYILGPGSTTAPIAAKLGLDKTLLGVDAVLDGELVACDASEKTLLGLLEGRRGAVVLSVIGGQGFILGRGNQQISARVIRKVGKENIVIVATPEKLASLRGQSLRVDTGDTGLDEELKGYYRVVTGYGRRTIIRVG
jgi:predicted polyphosphate/ATP-dependent NAD kinase